MYYQPTGGRSDKVVGSVLILAALGLAGFALYTAYRWTVALGWPAVPCTIVASGVQELGGETPYRFQVAYEYAWNGQNLAGRVFRDDEHGTSDIAEADRLARAFPVGARRTCFVNPRNPSEAVLRHENVLLPLAVVACMVPACWFLFAAFWRGERAAAIPGVLFVGGMGTAGFIGFFGWPVWTWAESLRWVPTPCVVRSAEIRSRHQHGEVSFTVYWPDIVYAYQVGGVAYRANTHNASFLGSPWYYGSRRMVRLHPARRVTTCFVDPSDPSRAVLERSFSGTQWFGIWPLMMVLIAIGALFEHTTGRKVRLGTPRLWGSLALAAASAFACLVLLDTGSDLLADRRAGVADVQEVLVVGVAGVVAAVLLAGWTRVSVRSRRGSGTAGLPN
jgi:hypothetical protein